MPENLTPGLVVAGLSQLLLLLVGLFLLWRLVLSPAGRAAPQRLQPWAISWFDFGLLSLAVLLGSLACQVLLGALVSPLSRDLEADFRLVLHGALFQGGLLVGVCIGVFALRHKVHAIEGPASVPGRPNPLLGGAATLVTALPVLLALNLLWTWLLERFGFPLDQQELVELFRRADSPALVGVVVFMAVLVAPVVEELIFRAGIFRFLRTRIPRPVALGLQAVVFALLHGNFAAFAPLVVLGITFALAYERSGRILVPIIAHGLFNLNTILLLLAGVTV